MIHMPVEKLEPRGGLLDEADVNANIRKVVKLLLYVQDISPDDLSERMPLKRSTLYTRLAERGKPTRFTAAEIYRMSRIFDVPVATFYEKPTISTDRSSRWIFDSPDLTCVDTADEPELPFPVSRDFAVVTT